MSVYTESFLKDKLTKELEADYCEVKDLSDGCGGKFDVVIVAKKFEGLGLLDRHRLVNNTLKEELQKIHAFTQKTLTPAQWEAKNNPK